MPVVPRQMVSNGLTSFPGRLSLDKGGFLCFPERYDKKEGPFQRVTALWSALSGLQPLSRQSNEVDGLFPAENHLFRL